jgi:aryl-alcohol dehydrogenase-like predicted oxidoreductase
MKQRSLGSSGPAVSAVGLGAMPMSDTYGIADDAGSIAAVRRALDFGMSFLDTADMYGAGHNEELVGRAIAGRREEVFVATKFFARFGPGATRSNWFTAESGRYGDTSPEWVPQACEASLRRLGVDVIDLYYMHRKLPQVPIEDTVGVMGDLVRAGKVRFLGLSEVSPATLRAAHAVHPIAAVQMEYSLLSRDIEGELLDTCRSLGVAVVAYSPFGRGLLTGTLTGWNSLRDNDFRRGVPRYAEGNIDRNLALVSAVRAVAAEVGCTPAQAALAWVLAQGEDIIPIPGTKRVRYVEENAAAVDVVLTPDQLARLDAAVPPGAAAGARYPEALMRSVGH